MSRNWPYEREKSGDIHEDPILFPMKQGLFFSLNHLVMQMSCLLPVRSLHSWEILGIENLWIPLVQEKIPQSPGDQVHITILGKSGFQKPVFVQSLSYAQLVATPWTAARQASLSFTISWSLLKLRSIELVMPSNHLILCRPLLLLLKACEGTNIKNNKNSFYYLSATLRQALDRTLS